MATMLDVRPRHLHQACRVVTATGRNRRRSEVSLCDTLVSVLPIA